MMIPRGFYILIYVDRHRHAAQPSFILPIPWTWQFRNTIPRLTASSDNAARASGLTL